VGLSGPAYRTSGLGSLGPGPLARFKGPRDFIFRDGPLGPSPLHFKKIVLQHKLNKYWGRGLRPCQTTRPHKGPATRPH